MLIVIIPVPTPGIRSGWKWKRKMVCDCKKWNKWSCQNTAVWCSCGLQRV